MIRKTFLPVLALMVLATTATAGPVYFQLVIDPATTAFSGIAPVTANGTTFTGTSTQSGAGRWHLYALDTVETSLGLYGYQVTLAGATTTLHRSPKTVWEDNAENAWDAGFALLRSNNNVQPILGSQPLIGAGVPPSIAGFGKEVSNFGAKIPSAVSYNMSNPNVNGLWGNYATKPTEHNWLFLAEGQYAVGTPPTISIAASTASCMRQDGGGEVCAFEVGVPLAAGEVPVLQDYTLGEPAGPSAEYVTAGDVLNLDLFALMQTGGDAATAWALSNFVYTPEYEGVNTNNAQSNVVFNTSTGQFDWNTQGANRGIYTWDVTATNATGSDVEQLSIHVQFVPEPATLALVGMALVGFIGIGRRR